MLNNVKQELQLDSIFSAYELHEIILQGTNTSPAEYELDEAFEISGESIGIDEMQIGKLYLCL